MLKAVSSITNAIGALNYKGTWNANTNSPALASGVGTKGDYYVVNVAGSTALDGISNWGIGDWAVFNGSNWQRVEGGADLNGVNLSVSGTSTLSGLTASTALALDANKNVVSVTNTGSGNNVLATSPTIATPSVTGDATLSTGNLVIGTAGKGIDFSADPHTSGMTSELLDDYEEGTWTPTGDGITLASASGRYTKIGDTVHLFFEVVFPTTANTGSAQIGGVPFSAGTSSRNGAAIGFTTDASGNTIVAVNSLLQIYNTAGSLTTNASNSTKQYYGVLTYKI